MNNEPILCGDENNMKILITIFNKNSSLLNSNCFKINCLNDVEICSSIISGHIFNMTTSEVLFQIINEYTNSTDSTSTILKTFNDTNQDLVTRNETIEKHENIPFYIIYNNKDLELNFQNDFYSNGLLEKIDYENKNITNKNRNFMFKNNQSAIDQYWLDVESGKF